MLKIDLTVLIDLSYYYFILLYSVNSYEFKPISSLTSSKAVSNICLRVFDSLQLTDKLSDKICTTSETE
ncbi:hypothetical protein TKY123642_17760 [Streptococcus pneumoniae]|nr:hypothetical protein TKY123642_17760 [Streptococcus pneumoniae]